jgi:hypothetical protein
VVLEVTTCARREARTLAVLAEFERDQISERTTTAMQHKRSRREYIGGKAPYGWRVAPDGVTLKPDPTEQRAIRVTAQGRAQNLSLRQIGDRLSARGMSQRNGRADRVCRIVSESRLGGGTGCRYSRKRCPERSRARLIAAGGTLNSDWECLTFIDTLLSSREAPDSPERPARLYARWRPGGRGSIPAPRSLAEPPPPVRPGPAYRR